MNYQNQLEQILDGDYRIVTIETYDVDRVIEIFTQLSRFSNKAYYKWAPNTGMHRIGTSHITIPRTKSTKEALQHIHNSKHYGIYILENFSNQLKGKATVEKLKQIATEDTPKTVIILGELIDLPRSLKSYTLRSKHQLRMAS